MVRVDIVLLVPVRAGGGCRTGRVRSLGGDAVYGPTRPAGCDQYCQFRDRNGHTAHKPTDQEDKPTMVAEITFAGRPAGDNGVETLQARLRGELIQPNDA